MRGISLYSHLCHLTCVFLKHCGQKTLCAELYKTRHEEDADRRGLASDRHSPGPPGLIFGQKYLMGVCVAVSADFRGYLLGYCVTRLQDEEDELVEFGLQPRWKSPPMWPSGVGSRQPCPRESALRRAAISGNILALPPFHVPTGRSVRVFICANPDVHKHTVLSTRLTPVNAQATCKTRFIIQCVNEPDFTVMNSDVNDSSTSCRFITHAAILRDMAIANVCRTAVPCALTRAAVTAVSGAVCLSTEHGFQHSTKT
ncbi:NACHT and WD repeat domain-containing protein 2 [Anabarilius grahami]|uniref:NACHT and WD repeat domain-containing protein 2 n=1 Tax=Anabarilius grahami TaxID=495550 RepID=A0A3N0YQE4_ANAGA|nr:NACHT and WD repeat domain-containing protein 2 [Anabarilius grahami]